MAQPYISTKFDVQHVEDGVYIGDIASSSNIQEMKTLGITHIVTAALGVSPQFPADFTYSNIPVMDVETENIKPFLDQTTQFINNALETGGKVLVHCMYGVSRSATVVAAWLMSRKGYDVDKAIALIKTKRECIAPNPSFRAQLEEYGTEKKMLSDLINQPSSIH